MSAPSSLHHTLGAIGFVLVGLGLSSVLPPGTIGAALPLLTLIVIATAMPFVAVCAALAVVGIFIIPFPGFGALLSTTIAVTLLTYLSTRWYVWRQPVVGAVVHALIAMIVYLLVIDPQLFILIPSRLVVGAVGAIGYTAAATILLHALFSSSLTRRTRA